MGTRKIAPALAAGCSVIIKPASETPLTMLALMPLLEEAGVPAGVVNVVPSRSSRAVVEAMLHDPRVRVLSFTGSTSVGRTLLRTAADQVLKPAMELGGNAPIIVFEDADLDIAVEGAMIAKMRNIGEACTAANRFYVHEAKAEDFTSRLSARMAVLKVGNGLDEGVDVGPLVNADTRNKVAALVEDALVKGAELRLGGKLPNGPGFFYQLVEIYWVSMNSSMPSWPPSRPRPDCFTPPNGAAGSETSPRLRPIIPNSNRSDTFRPRFRLPVNT